MRADDGRGHYTPRWHLECDDDGALALKCIDALHAARAYGVVRDGPHHSIVVAPNPSHVDVVEDPVALDAMRYPGVLVPCDLRDDIQRVVDLASTLGARGAVTVAGYCNGAAVAAYAAVCARARVSIGGQEPDITSVTFGIPIGTRVPCDAGTHYVSTRHTASMHPYALDTSHVRWVGEKDALYYANRVIGAFVRPVHNEPLGAYADFIRQSSREEHVPEVVVEADSVDSDWQMP